MYLPKVEAKSNGENARSERGKRREEKRIERKGRDGDVITEPLGHVGSLCGGHVG